MRVEAQLSQHPTFTLRTIKSKSRATFIPLWPFFLYNLLLALRLTPICRLDSYMGCPHFLPEEQSRFAATLYRPFVSSRARELVSLLLLFFFFWSLFLRPLSTLVDALFFVLPRNSTNTLQILSTLSFHLYLTILSGIYQNYFTLEGKVLRCEDWEKKQIVEVSCEPESRTRLTRIKKNIKKNDETSGGWGWLPIIM